ncbi:MAG: ABC transporter permease [Dehalococcoidia bacterium]
MVTAAGSGVLTGGTVGVRHRSYWWDIAVRLVTRKPLGLIGAVIVVVMSVAAVAAPVVARYDYQEIVPAERLKGPSPSYLFGTDNLGRDMFSRIVYGARISLRVGLFAVVISTTVASLIGVTSAYLGGWFDAITQRLVDALQALPGLILVLTIMAVLGVGVNNVILAIAIGGTVSGSRIIRSAALSIRGMPYIEAARTLGAPGVRVVFFHILPNVMAPAITLASIGLGAAILAESSLSFLGLGVPADVPTWGGMLSGGGRRWMLQAWWMAVFPGVALSLTVYGFNMLGDALRDLLDPRLRGSR